MVLLSIKSKSYSRLHSAHYKQVILKDVQVMVFKQGAAGWVRTRTQKGNSQDFILSVLCNSCIEGWSLKSLSHLLIFPLICLFASVLHTSKSLNAAVRCEGVLPSCNGHGCYQPNLGLHICQSPPHAPFMPRH